MKHPGNEKNASNWHTFRVVVFAQRFVLLCNYCKSRTDNLFLRELRNVRSNYHLYASRRVVTLTNNITSATNNKTKSSEENIVRIPSSLEK